MNHSIRIGILSLAIGAFMASPSHASLIDGLVGHWSLDGTLTDASPTGADGVFYDALHNGTETLGTPTYVPAPIGQGVNFTAYRDGSDNPVGQIVRVGEHAEHDFGASTDFSLAGWFQWENTDDAMVYSTIMGKKQSRGTNRAGYHATVGRINATSAYLSFRMSDGVNHIAMNAPLVLSTNIWYHFAVTVDRSGVAQIYLNGQTNGTATSVTSIGDINSPSGVDFAIGSTDWVNQQSFFDGSLNDLGVWNRQLTGEEIEFMASGNVIPEPSAALLLIMAFGMLGTRCLRARRRV